MARREAGAQKKSKKRWKEKIRTRPKRLKTSRWKESKEAKYHPTPAEKGKRTKRRKIRNEPKA